MKVIKARKRDLGCKQEVDPSNRRYAEDRGREEEEYEDQTPEEPGLNQVSSTHQLELPAAIVGVLYARVHPQSCDGGQVLQEDRGLQLPAGHLRRPGVERHQLVPVLLIVLLTPWDVQLFPGIHQHTYTWRRGEKVRSGEAH